MQQQSHRIQHLDFMRGLAVIVMVIGHSIDAVLSQEARATEAFRLYDGVRGFTAPMFLFISGYALAVVTLRRWQEFVAFGPAARKRLARMVMLLGLGYALHFPFFSLTKILHDTTAREFAQMFQVDILHCLSMTIILLQILMIAGRTPGRYVLLSSVFGGVVLFAAPVLWGMDAATHLSPVLAPYVNQTVPSLFPLFPFSVYLVAGNVVGLLHQRARMEGRESEFLFRVLVAGISAVGFGLLAGILPVRLYPEHDFWKASPGMVLLRIGVIAGLTSLFFRVRQLPERLNAQLAVLGRASLTVYVLHLVLVYGSAANPGLYTILGQTLPSYAAIAVAAGVVALMITLVHAWNTLREHHYYPLRLFEAGITSTLLYFFLTKPY